jgi:hypothetical protein
MTPVHVMLDIETLGTRPGAMIASIGACTFGDGKPRDYRHTFHSAIKLAGQDRLGLRAEPATLDWWLQQSPDALAALTRDAQGIGDAIWDFRAFVDAARAAGDKLRIWANGANFDPVMLEAVFDRMGDGEEQLCPWSFRDVRCLRTLLDVAGVDGKQFRPTVAHDALADAMAQADAAEEAMRRLGLIERPPA